MHAGLRDAAQFVFDRVFDGDDVFGFVARGGEGGVKRGRFAASGRAGHQNHAVRTVKQSAETLFVAARKAQLAQIGDEGRMIEQAHHDFFAVQIGQRRNAKIESARAVTRAKPSVLGQTLLGDVDVGQHFEARNQRQTEIERQHAARLQQAVDAVARQ